jgi:uncharacterized protein YndB with AHSA1/START domain
MPVCQVATAVGDSYRYEWQSLDGSGRFGFEGELLETEAPHRSVTTDRMVGTDGPSTKNDMTLTPQPGSRTRIAYPSKEVRDMIAGRRSRRELGRVGWRFRPGHCGDEPDQQVVRIEHDGAAAVLPRALECQREQSVGAALGPGAG